MCSLASRAARTASKVTKAALPQDERGHGELFFGSERGALTDLSAAEGDVAHPSDFPVRRSSLNCTLTMVP